MLQLQQQPALDAQLLGPWQRPHQPLWPSQLLPNEQVEQGTWRRAALLRLQQALRKRTSRALGPHPRAPHLQEGLLQPLGLQVHPAGHKVWLQQTGARDGLLRQLQPQLLQQRQCVHWRRRWQGPLLRTLLHGGLLAQRVLLPQQQGSEQGDRQRQQDDL